MAVAETTTGLGKVQQEEQQNEEFNQVAAEDVSWLQDVDFMMYKFKVALCNKHSDHDWDLCPYAHIGERTCRRRDPAKVNYTSLICVDMMQKGRCPRGRSCTAAHTIYEYWLHPHRYRTEMCKVGAHCSRRVCFFAHKPEELRPLPTHLVGSTGGASSGKYSLSATRQAAAKAAAATRVHTRLPSGSYPPALQQRLHYHPADFGTWGPGTPPAGIMPTSAVFGSMMQGSNFQQSLGMVMPDLAMLSGAADTGCQQPLRTEASIIRQMQQMALTSSSVSHAPSGSMSGGMAALQGPARWAGAPAMTGPISHSFGSGQEYLPGDSYMLGWHQQQQQQGLQGYVDFGGSMPAPSRMMPMQPPQEQEHQQQLLLHLLTAQGGSVSKPYRPASAAGQDAGFQSIGVDGVAVTTAMVHPSHLAVTQGPWMM